jgi:hypothetical protein
MRRAGFFACPDGQVWPRLTVYGKKKKEFIPFEGRPLNGMNESGAIVQNTYLMPPLPWH